MSGHTLTQTLTLRLGQLNTPSSPTVHVSVMWEERVARENNHADMRGTCKLHTEQWPQLGRDIFSHQHYKETMLNKRPLFKILLYSKETS